MKTFLSDIIPKIQRYSVKLDNLTLLTNQHWVVIDDISADKNVYIFRENNELLISRGGKVEKAKWEYLGHNSILIDRKDESFLFRHGFFDKDILALKIDDRNEYAFLVNETRFDKDLNSIENIIRFLSRQYIEQPLHGNIEDVIDNISTPQYSEIFLDTVRSFFGGRQEKFKIHFEDGKVGELFCKVNSSKCRIICNNTDVYYSNKISAIDALYFYLINGKILENNRTYI